MNELAKQCIQEKEGLRDKVDRASEKLGRMNRIAEGIKDRLFGCQPSSPGCNEPVDVPANGIEEAVSRILRDLVELENYLMYIGDNL
jgi:hypothetical protein